MGAVSFLSPEAPPHVAGPALPVPTSFKGIDFGTGEKKAAVVNGSLNSPPNRPRHRLPVGCTKA